MADETLYQPGAAGYVYNHGKNWSVAGVNANGNVTAHKGTPLINTLYVDNHVESKSPDKISYVVMGGPAYCYR